MTKFFRKIRQKMLPKNKFGNYLIYANRSIKDIDLLLADIEIYLKEKR